MRCEIKVEKHLISDPVLSYFNKQLSELNPRFDSIIRHLIITARDINGPRGGQDKECVIFAYLSSGRSIRISARAVDLYQAVDMVIEKTKARVANLKMQRISRRRWPGKLRDLSQLATM